MSAIEVGSLTVTTPAQSTAGRHAWVLIDHPFDDLVDDGTYFVAVFEGMEEEFRYVPVGALGGLRWSPVKTLEPQGWRVTGFKTDDEVVDMPLLRPIDPKLLARLEAEAGAAMTTPYAQA